MSPECLTADLQSSYLLYGEHCQGNRSLDGTRNFSETASKGPSKRPGLSKADTTSTSIISTWSRCLHRHLHIRWRDRKNPATEGIERAGIPHVHTLQPKGQVRLAGPCLQNVWQPTAINSYCRENSVRASTRSLKDLDISPSTWESLDQDRPTWRSKVTTGVENRRTV